MFDKPDNFLLRTLELEKLFVARLFMIILVLTGFFITVIGTFALGIAIMSTSWPATKGTIQKSGVNKLTNKEGITTAYRLQIQYKFKVKEQIFYGSRIYEGDTDLSGPSGNRDVLDKVIKKYPLGKQVDVYYMPAYPEICVLEPGVCSSVWGLPVGGIIFLVVGLAGAKHFFSTHQKKGALLGNSWIK